MDGRRLGGPVTAVLIVVLVIAVVVPFLLSYLVFRRVHAATLHPCAPDRVPGFASETIVDFVRLGFIVASALHITNPGLPDVYVVLLVNPTLNAYGRLWVRDRNPSPLSLVTPLRIGALVTSTSSPDSLSEFELQQIFSDASVDELCHEHARALHLLDERGVIAIEVTVGAAEPHFREEWVRDLQALRHAGPRLMVGLVVRTVLGRHRFKGPISEQRNIDRRISRLATS